VSATSSERSAEFQRASAKRGDVASRNVRPRPIGFYLTLLVLVIIVPALEFSILLLQRNNTAQQEALRTLAEATAGSISEAVDREIRGMLTTLRVLASGTSLREEDLQRFHARAQVALKDTGTHVIVLDENLNQLLNTRVEFGTRLGPTSDPAPARFAQEQRVAVVSDGFMGRTARRWVFNVILPPSVSGLYGRYLVMTQDAQNLSAALAQQNLRGGWNVSLVDRNGIVLASSYLSSDTGKPFFLGVSPRSGTRRGRAAEQSAEVEYVTVVSRSDLTNWSVVLWAPTASVDAPLRRTMLSLLLGGLAAVALATAAAWLLGRLIAKPASRLARDARRLGAGEEVAAVQYPIAEFATVSAAIAEAARDRRDAESEIRFLMREVAHRSKNQLTVVSSIAKQSSRNARNFAAFQDAFQKRLAGLARSTDLLIAGGVSGVDLRELVHAQIEPFQPSDAQRLRIEGPDCKLGNHAAQTIGLAAHELATNAAKYGAFSVQSGRLSVTWRIDSDSLDFVWRETVPRLRKRAETFGFGTQVIERMLGGTLDAEITRTMHGDGLEYRFVMPLSKLQATARYTQEAPAGG
jgi:two-component sensor histidine kinase